MKSNRQKWQFSDLFILLVLILMTLPFFVAGQDIVTRLLNLSGLAKLIQDHIIPIDIKIVIVLLSLIGISASGDKTTIVLGNDIELFKAQIIWSCIGWQSMLLVIISIITGIRGSFSLSSKIETIVIGLLGTFWINIFRLVFIYTLGYYFGKNFAQIIHNFAGTMIIFTWLFVYWWFSYKFVLEEKMHRSHLPKLIK